MLKKVIKGLNSEADGLKGSFLKNGLLTFINQFGNLFLNLILMIILRNYLGDKDNGIFVTGFTYAFLLAQIAIFGFDNLSIREVSSYITQNKFNALKKYFKYSITTVGLLSIVLTTISIAYFYLFKEAELAWYYTLSVILAPFLCLLMLLQFNMLGMGDAVASQTPEKLIRPLLLLIPVLILHFLSDELKLWQALVINLIAFILVFLLAVRLFNQRKKQSLALIQSNTEDSIPKNNIWLKAAFGLFIYSIIGHINGKIDIVMLEHLGDVSDVTPYNTANRFGSFVAFGTLIVNQLFGPIISNHFNRNEIGKLQQLIYKSSFFSLLIALPVLVFFHFGGMWMLELLFRTATEEEHAVLMIVSIGFLFQVLAGSAAFLLIMKKETAHFATISILVALIINILLNYLLIPSMGIIGASWGTAVALLVWTLLMIIFAYRKNNINPTCFSFKTLKAVFGKID